MTDEQKAAYVVAQVALLNANVARMQAANQYRMDRGETIAYGDAEFGREIEKFEVSSLGHNILMTIFHDWPDRTRLGGI